MSFCLRKAGLEFCAGPPRLLAAEVLLEPELSNSFKAVAVSTYWRIFSILYIREIPICQAPDIDIILAVCYSRSENDLEMQSLRQN